MPRRTQVPETRAQELFEAPGLVPATSILLWGEDRSTVNESAERLARWMDPDFLWVGFAQYASGSLSGPLSPMETPLGLRGVPGRGGGLPNHELGRNLEVAFRALVKGRSPRKQVESLLSLLRLPSGVAESAVEERRSSRFRVLVLADADRDPSLRSLFGRSAVPTLGLLKRVGVSPVLTWKGEPKTHLDTFDYVVGAHGRSLPKRVPGPLVCERGRGSGICLIRMLFPDRVIMCSARMRAQAAASLRRATPVGCPLQMLPTPPTGL